MPNKEHATSYTGRDGYIMGQALVYAIAHIQSLPREKQEYSNMCDMCIIARESDSSFFLPSYVISVFGHTGIKVDLWPEGEPVDERGIAQREAIETCLATWQEFIAKREAVKRNDGLVPADIPTFIRSFIDGQMSVTELDTFEKASMALQSWSNYFAVMDEMVKENDGIEFLEGGSNPAPLSEPEFIDLTEEDEASIKGAA